MVTTTCHQREGLNLTYPVLIGALLLPHPVTEGFFVIYEQFVRSEPNADITFHKPTSQY